MELSSTYSILKTASNHREEILAFRNNMAVKEVKKGRTEAPYYYIMPTTQRDPSELVKLVNLLKLHGIRVYITGNEVVLGDRVVEKGSVVVPLAQPFRAFAKEVLETQEYPVRRYTPEGPVIRPYDIATWSLPLHMGVKSWEIEERSEKLEASIREIDWEYNLLSKAAPGAVAVFPASWNESYYAAFRGHEMGLNVARLTEDAQVNGQPVEKGSFIISAGSKGGSLKDLIEELEVTPLYADEVPGPAKTVQVPRIALVETNFSDMDAGWTRYVMDTYHIPFTVVKPGDFEKTDFAARYDVVVFPSSRKSILMDGTYQSRGGRYRIVLPPQYAKGIGTKGMEKLMTFIDRGGIVVSWEQSTELFEGKLSIPAEQEKGKEKGKETEKEDFVLPFRNISDRLEQEGLYCPGSLVQVDLKQDSPLTLGMPDKVGVFYRGEPVFATSVPNFDMDRRVIGVTPEKNILLSGYIEKEELLGDKSLMIWMRKGKGQFVLFAFNPNFRASTHDTYKLLFNSLLL